VKNLTQRERVLLALAAAIAVILPLYEVVFAPQLHMLAVMTKRVEAQRAQVAAASADAGRLPNLLHAEKLTAYRLAAVEQQLPNAVSVAGLMSRLSRAISASGVQLIEVTFPQGTQPSPSAAAPVQELAFTVRLRGTFGPVVTFLRAIEAPPAFAAEQSLAIGPAATAAGGPGTLDITLAMKAIALR
jgi:Tfp pilus assembly protein PilO